METPIFKKKLKTNKQHITKLQRKEVEIKKIHISQKMRELPAVQVHATNKV